MSDIIISGLTFSGNLLFPPAGEILPTDSMVHGSRFQLFFAFRWFSHQAGPTQQIPLELSIVTGPSR